MASKEIKAFRGFGMGILSAMAVLYINTDWQLCCQRLKLGVLIKYLELDEHNIRVVGLSPGTVATEFMEKIREAKINVVSELDWSKHIPPVWAAEAVAFLCGPEGSRFAGTDFSIKTKDGRKLVGLPIDED